MDLVSVIEEALGARLKKLKKNEDEYQIFWVGVLEHRQNIDKNRDPIPYLISCGYGAIQNARLSENTKTKMRTCPVCGLVYSYRYHYCPHCMSENQTEQRVISATNTDGTDMEFEVQSTEDSLILKMDIDRFIQKLYGKEKYVAKRWLQDRADLQYENHLKQIALELNCSAPYVAKVKKEIRKKWQLMQYH